MAKSKLPVEKLSGKPVPVTIVDRPSPATSDKSYEERERKYRAEDAMRDLERAEKHRKDKGLMNDVKKLAQEKVKSLKGLC